MSTPATRTVIYAEWSYLNPQSIYFWYAAGDVSTSKNIVAQDLPLNERDLDHLQRIVGKQAAELVSELAKIHSASRVLFGGIGRSFTVLGPGEVGEGGQSKRQFVDEVKQVMCRVYGLDPSSRLVYQRFFKRETV